MVLFFNLENKIAICQKLNDLSNDLCIINVNNKVILSFKDTKTLKSCDKWIFVNIDNKYFTIFKAI